MALSRPLSCLFAAVLTACAGGQSGDPLPNPQPTGVPRPNAQGPEAPEVPALQASLVATVPDGTYGPYVGEGPGGAVAIWAASSGDDRKWTTVPLEGGKPLGIADAPEQIGLVVVRPFAVGPDGTAAAGFVVVFTRPGADGDTVDTLLVGARGELVAAPASISPTHDEVVWVEAVPTPKGAVALWAVRQGDRADIHAVELSSAGERSASTAPIFRHVRAWQAVRTVGGLALAAVTAGKDPGMPGPVKMVFLDTAAKVEGDPLVLSAETTAELDLDAARLGDDVVVVWSDHRRVEPRLYRAVVDSAGKLTGDAGPLTKPEGEQALIRVVPPLGPKSAGYVAWEEPGRSPRGSRSILLAPLDATGTLGDARGRIQIAADDGTLPELAASPEGLAALTLAPVCQRGDDCEGAERLPTFVELDASFEVTASEPMLLDPLGGAAAELAWGLSCTTGGCRALAARAVAPAPVYAVDLDARSNAWRAPASRVVAPPPPRMATVEAIAAPDPLSEVAAVSQGEVTLAGWITFFDPTAPYERRKTPAPDGRYDPLRALLQVASTKNGDPFAEPHTISLRARTFGGVSLAPGNPAHGEVLLAWSAIDRDIPQVFLTILGEDGVKKRQQMLTRSKGEVSDIDVAYTGDDGWIVGWVDERNDDPEVYVAKVNRLLQRRGLEQRLTDSAGSATGVTLLPRGDEVLVAWADAGGGARGMADIYVRRVKSADASPVGDAVRLATTAPHSHSPALASWGSGAVVVWVEDDAQGAVVLGQLDANGTFTGDPLEVRTEAKPHGVSIDCRDDGCRVVFAAAAGGTSSLYAFRWTPGGQAPKPRLLRRLSAPADESVSPAFSGPGLLFADQTAQGDGRVRWMTIDWQ